MTVQEALKQAVNAREKRVSLTDRSSKVARAHQKARRQLEQTILDAGKIFITVKEYLPLAGEAEVVDPAARTQMRRILETLLSDERYRPLSVRYTRDTPDKPDKRIGMSYRICGKMHNSKQIKGSKRSPETQAEINERTGVMQIWCNQRKDWRSIKVGAISEVSIVKDGVRHWIPVEYVTPDGKTVTLNWQDTPVREKV